MGKGTLTFFLPFGKQAKLKEMIEWGSAPTTKSQITYAHCPVTSHSPSITSNSVNETDGKT